MATVTPPTPATPEDAATTRQTPDIPATRATPEVPVTLDAPNARETGKTPETTVTLAAEKVKTPQNSNGNAMLDGFECKRKRNNNNNSSIAIFGIGIFILLMFSLLFDKIENLLFDINEIKMDTTATATATAAKSETLETCPTPAAATTPEDAPTATAAPTRNTPAIPAARATPEVPVTLDAPNARETGKTPQTTATFATEKIKTQQNSKDKAIVGGVECKRKRNNSNSSIITIFEIGIFILLLFNLLINKFDNLENKLNCNKWDKIGSNDYLEIKFELINFQQQQMNDQIRKLKQSLIELQLTNKIENEILFDKTIECEIENILGREKYHLSKEFDSKDSSIYGVSHDKIEREISEMHGDFTRFDAYWGQTPQRN